MATLLGAGNPLLDISASVDTNLLDKCVPRPSTAQHASCRSAAASPLAAGRRVGGGRVWRHDRRPPPAQ